jgi:hypothetical protein
MIKMEYGNRIDGESSESNDYNFKKFVGWKQSAGGNDEITKMFGNANIDNMSRTITSMLNGVDPKGRPIIVPNHRIADVLTTMYNAYEPPVGDIHSRFIVTARNGPNYLKTVVDETIQVIAQQVKDTLGMDTQNKDLTVWTTVLGNFNTHGLQSHPKIKLREKHPALMQFHMRY